MAFEKKMAAVPPQPLVKNGDQFGTVTLQDTASFKVKQFVYLQALSLPNVPLEVKRVLNRHTLIVGPRNSNINDFTDISAYTITNAAVIFADAQNRRLIPEQDVPVVTYEEEPTVAQRVIQVDKYGNKYDQFNRMPTDPEGPGVNIIANLLTMLVQGPTVIPPNTYIVNNENFFIFDNEGNLIEAD